jgi:pyridoxamine 5'-phosphate oxidase
MTKEMPMTREEILWFLNHNPVCHVATMEEGRPRVRGMFMYRADDRGLLFHTGSFKALAKQVRACAPVEVCFNSSDVQVRVSGVAEVVDDMELKKEVVSTRPFMQPWIAQHGYEMLVLFRVTQCRAAVWTMDANFKPTSYQDL